MKESTISVSRRTDARLAQRWAHEEFLPPGRVACSSSLRHFSIHQHVQGLGLAGPLDEKVDLVTFARDHAPGHAVDLAIEGANWLAVDADDLVAQP